jgi:hypothetical protein
MEHAAAYRDQVDSFRRSNAPAISIFSPTYNLPSLCKRSYVVIARIDSDNIFDLNGLYRKDVTRIYIIRTPTNNASLLSESRSMVTTSTDSYDVGQIQWDINLTALIATPTNYSPLLCYCGTMVVPTTHKCNKPYV